MKVQTIRKEKQFEPFELHITIESKAEQAFLREMANQFEQIRERINTNAGEEIFTHIFAYEITLPLFNALSK